MNYRHMAFIKEKLVELVDETETSPEMIVEIAVHHLYSLPKEIRFLIVKEYKNYLCKMSKKV